MAHASERHRPNQGLVPRRRSTRGWRGQNRTLGLKNIEAVEVPVRTIERQSWFNRMQMKVRQVQEDGERTAIDVGSVIPDLLHEAFNGKAQAA